MRSKDHKFNPAKGKDLTQHITAQVLNVMHKALMLLMDETVQVKKVILQNHIVLEDMNPVMNCRCTLGHCYITMI